MDTHGNPLTTEERSAFFAASTLRIAVERGFRGCTFATRDEAQVPGYDAAYERGRQAGLKGLPSPPV